MSNKIKQLSIKTMLDKYELEPGHAEQVKNLSLLIFDKTLGAVHNMSGNERELLEAGALLHDIGYHISAKNHHKNSQKLILQEGLPGFSRKETEIIANIARYHRGKLPCKKHRHYISLSQNDRQLVNGLSAFVRLADALDRSHCSVVKDMDFSINSASNVLNISLRLNTPVCYPEIYKAQDKKDLFEQEFGLELRFNVT